MNYRDLKQTAFRTMCRRCINERYGLHLRTQDCCYFPYPEECRCCGNVRNIVADICRRSRWQLLFAPAKPTDKP